MGKDHKDLSVHLTQRRKEAGITQANLAEAVQVTRKSINSIENGIYVPSTVLALKIATVLNCDVEDLFKLHDGTFPLLMESNEYE
mgnify:FL=1|tara:strand:+ start:137 stop:391 length:255 start_codon:yes stop_codon:yes gene_type:complete